LEKFIQKSKIIADLGFDSNFSEIFEDHSKNEEVRRFSKRVDVLERYAAWISNIKAGKSHRALKRIFILISVKFMHKIVPFEEFQFLVKSYLSKFFSSHASISLEPQR